MPEYDRKGNEVEIKAGAVYYKNGSPYIVEWGHEGYYLSRMTKHPLLTKLSMLIEQRWKWYWTVIIVTYLVGILTGILVVLLLL